MVGFPLSCVYTIVYITKYGSYVYAYIYTYMHTLSSPKHQTANVQAKQTFNNNKKESLVHSLK